MTSKEMISSWNESQFKDFSCVLSAKEDKSVKGSLVARWRQQDPTTAGAMKQQVSAVDFTSCIDESIRMQDLGHGLGAIKNLLDQSR